LALTGVFSLAVKAGGADSFDPMSQVGPKSRVA
jgi:hypothetical protein